MTRLDLNNYVITVSHDEVLVDALKDENSDEQAWATFLFTALVEESKHLPNHPCIEIFFDKIIFDGTLSLSSIALLQLREGRHSWLKPYIIQKLKNCDRSTIPKLTQLLNRLVLFGAVNPYYLVPDLIDLLHEGSASTQKAALDSIAEIESLGAEPLSEFVRSSYDWHIRSIHLRRERLMSVFGILGTISYGIILALIASLSVQLWTSKEFFTSIALNLSFLMLVLFMASLSVYYATNAEKELEKCLSISYDFLDKRKEMRKKVQNYFIRLLEKRHEKWRGIFNTVVRLYIVVSIPSLLVLLLGRLPSETTEGWLIGFTLLFIALASISYKKMRDIENELIRKQRALRDYYGQ